MSKRRLPRPAFLAVCVFALVAAVAARYYLTMPVEEDTGAPPAVVETKVQPEDINDILNTGTKLYSQVNEELVIRDFFRDRTGGVFVDVGCAWPIYCSTTYYLEKHLNWTGIAIDALEYYRPLWEEKRPNTKFFAYAVTDHSGDRLKFYAAPMAWGLSSLSQEHVESWDIKPAETEVETITLNDLLDKNGITKIDFLSMDIEGSEPGALAGFDIERFGPSLVCIEMLEENKQPLTEYFTAHGYERIDRYLEHDSYNWYFTPAGKAPPEEDAPSAE